MGYDASAHAKRFLWAGFFSIFAAGVGFGIRGRILVAWASEYGFTQTELGSISGGGFWGFGLVIIAGCLLADALGYGKLMIFAFIMHIASLGLQMATGPIFHAYGQQGVYWSLLAAMVLFSIANGTCEVVVNPMVAASFPQQKTHYLNILHAGWPGGLITGGVIAYLCNDVFSVHWLIQMSLVLVPVFIYGLMLLGHHGPRSEANQAGVSFTTMLAEFAAPMLLLLLVIHAMVGYVELGTDNWITKITGSIFENPAFGVLLFIYTSGLMFILRFFAGPIEQAVSPLGLLFGSAILAAIGLTLLGNLGGIMLIVAATVYGVGKTFFWPTMLAVVSERFPRGGALTLGAVGGVGMLSAGFLGGPGIGFMQDHYASQQLKEKATDTYARYAADQDNAFLGIFKTRGLDGAKTALLDLAENAAKEVKEGKSGAATHDFNTALDKLRKSDDANHKKLYQWWEENAKYASQDAPPVDSAGLYGGRMALKWTALVPAAMAVLYLLLILYFKTQGGYRKVELQAAQERAEEVPWEG